jgi:cytochrome P450
MIWRKSIVRARRAPSPPARLLGGHLHELRQRPLAFIDEAMRTYGDVIRLRLGSVDAHLVCHPDGVSQILQRSPRSFDKQTRAFNQLRRLFGKGLVTSEGETWLRQRRIAQPSFHRESLAAYGAVMARAAAELVQRWARAVQDRGPLDVSAQMTDLSLRIIGETLLGTDLSVESSVIRDAVECALAEMNRRFTSIVDLPLFVPTHRNRRLRAALRTLDELVASKIAARQARQDEPNDMLTALLHARDSNTGQAMSERQLRDEVLTLLVAGHETVASALTWTLYLLARHPAIQRQLRAELGSVLGDRPPTVDDLPKLTLNRMIIQESMRLYPPIWLIGRRVVEDVEIGGCHIAAGSRIFVSPYATHRHPDHWPHPSVFDPARFTPEQEATRSRFVYFPFGGGPRVCIGNTFALMELQLVVATVIQSYHMEGWGPNPIPEPAVTLRARDGLRMIIRGV